MTRRFFALIVLPLAWSTVAGAQSHESDPTPETTPDIELDNSFGDRGVLEEKNGTWDIVDSLGVYGDSGKSLFHSFGRFNVAPGKTAEFRATQGRMPERVFARVTWGEPTIIEGTLRNAISSSDLYLINPAGIDFAGRGKVDVSGSFYATTAGRIIMKVEGQVAETFEAYGGAGAPLLSAEPSAFGFYPASVDASSGSINFISLNAGLSVPNMKTFAAIGGSVTLNHDGRPIFVSNGSRIALIAAGPSVEVQADDLASFDPAGFAPGIELGDVVIRNSGVFASIPAGSILIRGDNFVLENASGFGVVHVIAAESKFPIAIDVAVRDSIQIRDSVINVVTTLGGKAGDVTFSGNSFSISGDSSVHLETRDAAPGSSLTIDVRDQITIGSEAILVSNNSGSNLGGNIELIARKIVLKTGGRVLSSTSGAGSAGHITLNAEFLSIDDSGFSAQGTFVKSLTTGDGLGANIDLNIDDIQLESGGQILAETHDAGASGKLTIRAQTVDVSGLSGSGATARASLIGSRASEGSTGTAGSDLGDGTILGVDIEAERILIGSGGQVGTETLGTGNAGNVIVVAHESLRIEGGDHGPASLLSEAQEPTGGGVDVGNTGRITVDAGEVVLRNGGQISTSTKGVGSAGLIEIHAASVDILGTVVDTEAGIFSQTLGTQPSAGSGGTIVLNVEGRLVMGNGSRISVESRNDADAGDISIEARDGVMLVDGASITATSTKEATGRAGSITIDAGPALEMSNSSIRTKSEGESNPGGGQITIVAQKLVSLTNSSINTSVQKGNGDGGDIRIDPDLVVLNSSQVLADAFDGDGGRIFIRAGAFVQSADSLVRASSLGPGSGIDGEVIIESPDTDLAAGTSQLPQQYLDTSGLMKTACAAREGGLSSLVVTQIAGLPATPHGPLPSRLWDDAWLQEGRADVARTLHERGISGEPRRLASIGSKLTTSEFIP